MDIDKQKWQKFSKRIWPFQFIPFIDFVFAAGSLATGNMHENSDFDVIVAVQQGRIFTARFFCVLVFGLLGWRRKRHDKSDLSNKSNGSYSNKICFNHFVTPTAYRLSPPYNEYWKKLYQSLVPVYGDKEKIHQFFNTNEGWAGRPIGPIRLIGPIRPIGLIGRIGQVILSGWFGDTFERILKKIQIRRIEQSLSSQTGYKPRIVYNDNELEFHPDTKRIEEKLLEKIEK